MAQDALKSGIKLCTRANQTTVNTVRKMVKRYQKNKEADSPDLFLKKEHYSIKIDKEKQLKILKCRKAHPRLRN